MLATRLTRSLGCKVGVRGSASSAGRRPLGAVLRRLRLGVPCSVCIPGTRARLQVPGATAVGGADVHGAEQRRGRGGPPRALRTGEAPPPLHPAVTVTHFCLLLLLFTIFVIIRRVLFWEWRRPPIALLTPLQELPGAGSGGGGGAHSRGPRQGPRHVVRRWVRFVVELLDDDGLVAVLLVAS